MSDKKTYKTAGPATWELIRAAYLSGDTAPALAERFGVSEHGIRKRITVEGWSKRDYARSLEARGIREKTIKRDYIEEGVLREQLRRDAEAASEAEASAWVEQVAAETAPDSMADALERRALAQAGAALVRGKPSDARALASLAEQMRKLSGERVAPAPGGSAPGAGYTPPPRAALDEGERGEVVNDLFAKIASIAAAMLHAPITAPDVFLRLIKQWRMINLGEGEADAEVAARRVADAQAHYLRGDYFATFPEEVRAHMQSRWAEYVAREEGRLGE